VRACAQTPNAGVAMAWRPRTRGVARATPSRNTGSPLAPWLNLQTLAFYLLGWLWYPEGFLPHTTPHER